MSLAPAGAAACGTWKAYDAATGMLQQRNAADTKASQDAAVDMRALRGGLSEPLPLVPDGCNMPLVMEGSAAANMPLVMEGSAAANMPLVMEGSAAANMPLVMEGRFCCG
jgi:hypothetical protein